MKYLLIISLSLLLLSFSFPTKKPFTEFKDGDMIFHTSQSAQSGMVSLVTRSKLTHCGIVFYKNGKPMVLEAVNPVKVTSLNSWIARGKGGKYKVVRLKQELTGSQKSAIHKYAAAQLGKKYDIKFQWSSSKMYCSELVWKAYYAAGIKLCEPSHFSDYNLSSSVVQYAIKQRYGTSINPNEKVVTPVDVYSTELGKVVYDNY